MVSRSRRGMSPLIATVLLMAFAVAFGGMIMNWSSTLGSEVDCSGIALSTERFCYTDSAITLKVRNTGDSISSLGLVINNPQSGEIKLDLPDSKLNKGATLSKSVPVLVNDQTTISIEAKIGNDDQKCGEPIIPPKKIPKC